MKLKDIAEYCSGKIVGDADLDITSISQNSKKCKVGSLFVAVQGEKSDGHRHIGEAIECGAVAAVVENTEALKNNSGIVVNNSRESLSKLAAFFCGEPARKLKIIGITGTNGKTTTHWIAFHFLQALGKKVGRIGTIGIMDAAGNNLPNPLTTPGPLALHEHLAKMKDQGIEFVVIEASSHALVQHRVDDALFDIGVFTNISRDHLDYHKDIVSYCKAKQKLFRLVKQNNKDTKVSVINIDDEYAGSFMEEGNGTNVLTYGQSDKADLIIKNFSSSIDGSTFELGFKENFFTVRSPYIGLYNAYNLAAALLVCIGVEYTLEDLLPHIRNLPQVPGRLQSVGNAEKGIYVDYAHTPDALENALLGVKELTKGDVWVIFGCGGDRDRGKRPQMGAVASKLADKVIVTSDNPRTEDPQKIINDILSEGFSPFLVEVDRKRAIQRAVHEMKPGDLLLIAGKGHEDYQIIGETKFPFSDAAVVCESLK